jgi:nitrous oxidase accessory protein NosD
MHVLLAWLSLPTAQEVRILTADDTRIERSCRLEIRASPIADAAGDGVLRIVADDVVVDFAGSHLQGSPPGTAPDERAGTGVVVSGRRVTIRGARISGFRCAIQALRADDLVVEDCDLSENFAQRLRSTSEAEDAADWLWPNQNDGNEWLSHYGAALWIEDTARATVRRCRAWHAQNGLVLDGSSGARVYDNDFSFLSGWGVALWRASDNRITRNALDFCVRGYSHGVYNRGQDSAGILMFEQCQRNQVVENSVTHGGDGFFGFAGRDALGEDGARAGVDYARRGNTGNLLVANDFSYAPAHGIEMTFSSSNVFARNRVVENAICGVWGGYSSETWIVENLFERNGEAGYGLERGGVNIEHGRNNRVERNRFVGNACGVHLWWDEDASLAQTPWARANGVACADNEIHCNTFDGDAIGVRLRSARSTSMTANPMQGVAVEIELDEASDPPSAGEADVEYALPELEILGDTRPVGARAHLRGRDKIIVGEWGPYDWQSPLLVREHSPGSARHVWRLLGGSGTPIARIEGEARLAHDGDARWVVEPARAGAAVPYTLRVELGAESFEGHGLLIEADWSITVFAWRTDPRQDLAAWRAEAAAGTVFTAARLALDFGMDGPSELTGVPEPVRAAALAKDRFGTIARARLELPAGRWRVTSTSDDGVRVLVDGRPLIENWTWHGPTRDQAVLELPNARMLELLVEHFELDGFAVLELALEPEG